MLHIALCDDNPASIEILEKYFDILNDWSYVKKKYKLNTTNFLFLCNC